MQIRQAEDSDITSIVTLLKSSLGEGLTPKSEEYWSWKHLKNPFGKSPVLVATEESKIIGVRAFMRWEWRDGAHKIIAVRAVDTATDPAFQGRGIFRKLTESMLHRCKAEGIHLVFNTPNEKSRPGYLKMGWEVAGRIGVNLSLRRPFHILGRTALGNKHRKIETYELASFSHSQIPMLLNKWANRNAGRYATSYTQEYLKWRYCDVPVGTYKSGAVESGNVLVGLLVYRLKMSRMGLEMRITDCFVESESHNAAMRAAILEHARESRADFITVVGWPEMKLLGWPSFAAPIGPVVTVRGISTDSLDNFVTFRSWRPVLGDLELF